MKTGKEKKITLNGILKLTAIFGILIISGTIFYHLAIHPKQMEKELDICLAKTKTGYLASWNAACKENGKKYSCSLPKHQAKALNETLQSNKETCFRRYPVK